MKTPSGTVKLGALIGLGLCLALTIVFAQGKGGGDPAKSGIRLIMGHNHNAPLHCTEESLMAALRNCDEHAYRIKFEDPKNGKHWEKGSLNDLGATDVTVSKPDTGGPTATPMTGMTASGVHSTQQVAFSNTDELKAFVTALQSAP